MLNLSQKQKCYVCFFKTWKHPEHMWLLGQSGLTWWMSQLVSLVGTWTCPVFLSTVRFTWLLSRSSFTLCHCRSSSRLPRAMRSCPPGVEPTPGIRWRKELGALMHASCYAKLQIKPSLASPTKLSALTNILRYFLTRGENCICALKRKSCWTRKAQLFVNSWTLT